MESQRQLKISRMLQREISEIFQRETRGKFGGAMITVTKVNITSDMSVARVYLSLFATNDKTTLLDAIQHHTSEIRYHLGKRIRNQVRAIPEIEFYLDDSLDYIDKIEGLLEE
jgi:ribosome-binding factor A